MKKVCFFGLILLTLALLPGCSSKSASLSDSREYPSEPASSITESEIPVDISENQDEDSSVAEPCFYCDGEGLIQCGFCMGDGINHVQGGICPRCQGPGKISCFVCGGSGTLDKGKDDNGGQTSYPSGNTGSCGVCGGTGSLGYCVNCSGTGTVKKIEFAPDYGGGGGGTYEVEEPCPLCVNGEKICYACGGTGR
ncbi:hypothetical protein [Candidatus Soleaferrea massiliensis]|uniref:hypothetical protein n=1 Tax=Candidatus Soleaferrea massiliensis TaxID=1470354 RepID=UPI00058E0E91|nr:hypothetical protein [Candidatus Soleaferrea massiliensis]